MGNYRIEIEAVGGHGCNREAKAGQVVAGCQKMGCPDCELRRLLDALVRNGSSLTIARFVNWPGSPEEVVDETKPASHWPGLETRRVKGDFGG